MGQEHPSAAVALQAELVEGLAGVDTVALHQLEVLVPLVADNLKCIPLNMCCGNTLPQVKHLTGMIIFNKLVYKKY